LAPLHRQRIGISSSSALKRHRSRAAATPWTSRSWRRRRGEDGRRFVPPVERPSASVAAKKGRERPRPNAVAAAPKSPGGVAHAPHVSVGDVLGRVCEVRVNPARERRAFSGQSAPRINADAVPDSASLLPLGRIYSAGCASTARLLSTLGIGRDIATRNPRCAGAHSFVHAHAHSSRTPDAPTKNSPGAMARVKAPLLPSAPRGLDPRHELPDLGRLSERQAGDATWHIASDGKRRNAHLAVVDVVRVLSIRRGVRQ